MIVDLLSTIETTLLEEKTTVAKCIQTLFSNSVSAISLIVLSTKSNTISLVPVHMNDICVSGTITLELKIYSVHQWTNNDVVQSYNSTYQKSSTLFERKLIFSATSFC